MLFFGDIFVAETWYFIANKTSAWFVTYRQSETAPEMRPSRQRTSAARFRGTERWKWRSSEWTRTVENLSRWTLSKLRRRSAQNRTSPNRISDLIKNCAWFHIVKPSSVIISWLTGKKGVRVVSVLFFSKYDMMIYTKNENLAKCVLFCYVLTPGGEEPMNSAHFGCIPQIRHFI